jgi:hypothetical protein
MSNKALALGNLGWPALLPPRDPPAKLGTKYRAKLLAKDGVMLPGKHYAAYGQIVTVPKRAIYDISSQLTRGL